MKIQGFTLLELLVTLTITAILLTIAIPGFSRQIQKERIVTTAQTLITTIETARSQAVFRNERTVLLATPKWNDGWIVFFDRNNNGIKDDEEPLISEQKELMSNVEISDNFSKSAQISFINTGESRQPGKRDRGAFIAGTIKVCPKESGDGIKLVLNRAGRLRSEKIKYEECLKK
ncbi:MAG: GspH/FimT family protein [Cellvibrio sp.]|uniref:GspH/FimT family pseudopilin n=1 Tax=Cellvibrio sp. TaxID=1965322 RepID=UPI0031AA8535